MHETPLPLRAPATRPDHPLRRLAAPVQALIYQYDPTYRAAFSLTLLNLELLCESLGDEGLGSSPGTLLTHEVRFEMDLASGVVWETRQLRRPTPK